MKRAPEVFFGGVDFFPLSFKFFIVALFKQLSALCLQLLLPTSRFSAFLFPPLKQLPFEFKLLFFRKSFIELFKLLRIFIGNEITFGISVNAAHAF